VTMSRRAPALAILWVTAATALPAAQTERSLAAPPDVAGVYQSIANDRTLPGGLRNMGAPEDIALVRAAVEQMKSIDLTQDPEKLCQPIGPFRMMARAGAKIELAYAKGAIVMLFEDISHGHIRTIHLNRAHAQESEPTWQGHSVGRWDGNTLVIDTSGFNERTWLNAAGAQHSDALRLVERVKPILDGKYLEYRVTVEDPQVLAKPYTYFRYFERVQREVAEDVCEP
jgi:hypothetical protein